MENNNSSNKGVMVLLIVIIVILAVLCVLFATGTISFNTTTNTTNDNQQNNNSNQNNVDENNQAMTETEAINILKDVFTNDTVQYLISHKSITYCDKETTVIREEDLGLNYQWNGYHKCKDFKSYEELTNYFKKYVTDDFFNNTVLKTGSVRQTIESSDGKIMYNYYEKDGNLYAAITGKGSNIMKYKLLDNDTIYKIDSSDNNKITATITAKWEQVDESVYSELIKITIIKDSSNWKVSSYSEEETN